MGDDGWIQTLVMWWWAGKKHDGETERNHDDSGMKMARDR